MDRPIPIQHISSVAISSDLTHIAIGLTTGYIVFIGPPEKASGTLYSLPESALQFLSLNPEAGFTLPVTNLHLLEFLEKTGKSAWLVFGTCEKAFYLHHVSGKKGTFSVITGLQALPREMDAVDDTIVILDSQNNELRRYKGADLEDKWTLKESGKVRIVGKQVMVIQASEKNKTIRVYDMENEIISYQAVVSDIFADVVAGGNICLLLKGSNSRIMQTLREKTNIDKLEAFLRKRHYDVAYKFAKNEKFSEEVLADISRYYGDFFLSKVLDFVL